MINPNNKLPPSPKNSLGSPRKEKLKNKKKLMGIIIITKKSWIFCSPNPSYISKTDGDNSQMIQYFGFLNLEIIGLLKNSSTPDY